MRTAPWRDIHGSSKWPYLLFLAPLVTVWPWYLSKVHYTLPAPKPPVDDHDRPQISDQVAFAHMQALEEIGYRTVGTEEALRGEQYVLDRVNEIATRCNRLECGVMVQKGSGYHAFNILDHEVLKVYSGIRNIVLRISAPDGSTNSSSNSNALLLGSHIDSTLPSPGAADDGMGVGVMLDLARVIVDRDEPFDNTLLFMWNGGEETLQDGSHLYSTQHPSAVDVKAVINLEAAGTTGGALLFQATSKEMIEAFAHVPHPRGTVAAADVFASGIILSDTDFGQFEKYLGVSGLDMAIVGHSYFYHTRSDSVEFIERGSAQHFGENVLAIIDHLTARTQGEEVGSLTKPDAASALSTGVFTPPDMVYLSLFDRWFFFWSMEAADKAYVAIAAIVAVIVGVRATWDRGMVVALVGAPLGIIGAMGSANLVAGLMVLRDARQVWFPHEHLSLLLFGPAAILGHLAPQHLLARFVHLQDRPALERHHYHAQLIISTLFMLLLQWLRIRSAYIFAGITSFLLTGVLLPGVWGYILPIGLLTMGTVEAVTSTLDIFTPLTGRMGKDAPADFIIASLSAGILLIMLPAIVPLYHRLPRPTQRKVLFALAAAQNLVVIGLASPFWHPYDRMHPKRIALQYHYNHTSGLANAHIAFMDLAQNKPIVKDIHERYGAGPLEATTLTEYDSDWDVLYPLPAFLDTWQFPITTPSTDTFQFPQPGVEHTELESLNGVRRLKLRFDFTGLVWPVLAFEAEVVSWSFDFEPPKGHKRHHLKIVASIDQPIVDFELDIRSRTVITNDGIPTDTPLNIHYSALDLNQMVPGTASRRGPDMPASVFLMDADNWAREKWKGSLDFVMCGTVAGVITV